MDEIRETLAEFVRRHSGSQPQAEGFIDVAGKIDPNEPEPIQELRRRLRLLGGEYSTEKAYVKWAAQFLRHFGIKSIEQLSSLGEAEVVAGGAVLNGGWLPPWGQSSERRQSALFVPPAAACRR